MQDARFAYNFMWRASRTLIVVGLLLSASLGGCVPGIDNTRSLDKLWSGSRQPPDFHNYEMEGRTIRYAETGDRERPLVVFVHGSPGSWKSFAALMADRELRNRAHLIAVDRPGYGGSDYGSAEKSLERQAALLQPVLNQNFSDYKAILVGHSYGGPVIARLAIDYPAQVGGLIMISPALDPSLEKTIWYQHMAKWTPFRWIASKDLLIANEEIMPLKRELKKMLPLWEKIRNPVTIIHGEDDRFVSVANAKFALRVLVNADLNVHVLPGEDHFIPWTRPELLKAAIFIHLDKNRQSASHRQ